MSYLDLARERDLILGDLAAEIRSAPRGVAADPPFPYHYPDEVPDFKPRFRITMAALRGVSSAARDLDRAKLSLDASFVRHLFSLTTRLIAVDADTVDKEALRTQADSLARLVAGVRTKLERPHGSDSVPLPGYSIHMASYAKHSDLDASSAAVLAELEDLRNLATKQATDLMFRMEIANRYNDALHGKAEAIAPPQSPDNLIDKISGIDAFSMSDGLSGSGQSISDTIQNHESKYMSLKQLNQITESADYLTEQAGVLSALIPSTESSPATF
jgi:hypothetical protein